MPFSFFLWFSTVQDEPRTVPLRDFLPKELSLSCQSRRTYPGPLRPALFTFASTQRLHIVLTTYVRTLLLLRLAAAIYQLPFHNGADSIDMTGFYLCRNLTSRPRPVTVAVRTLLHSFSSPT
jgi:hypothetical protein